MSRYDIPVNFSIAAETEEQAVEQILAFLKMAKLDFGLTFDVRDYELVEFIAEEGSNV